MLLEMAVNHGFPRPRNLQEKPTEHVTVVWSDLDSSGTYMGEYGSHHAMADAPLPLTFHRLGQIRV